MTTVSPIKQIELLQQRLDKARQIVEERRVSPLLNQEGQDACFSTHLLSRWVREKELLSLEEAVRLLTSRSAEVFELTDRGRLEVGLPADVAIFDPETVGCSPLRRVHDFPGGADRLIADAQGMHAVIVNGQIIREQDRDSVDPEGPLPGQLLRSSG